MSATGTVTATAETARGGLYERPWLYPEQERAFFGPDRFALVEASTKSGKTVGCIAWLFEQAALEGRAGRHYWWVAPTLPVAKIAYRRTKRAIPRALYRANDTDCTLTLANGATIWYKGADRPDLLYGEDVYAAVIDETSRCKEEAWTAVRTTLTATRGPARLIGNVHGKRNWAYALCRRAQAGELRDAAYYRLTADDAIRAGIFPAAEASSAREHMPEAAWRELYYAEASDDGSNPFGLQAIADCVGPLSSFPAAVFGWDFGRAQDWTVGIGLDWQSHTAQWDRWQGVPWGETYERVKRITGTAYSWGDSTGVGDAVVEGCQRVGVTMNGYHFTPVSKQLLMERLASAIQQRKVRYPDGLIRLELESFGYTYTPRGVRYTVPPGFHDDCVVALALAVYARDQAGFIADPTPVPDRPQDVQPSLTERYRHRLLALGILEEAPTVRRSRYKSREAHRL